MVPVTPSVLSPATLSLAFPDTLVFSHSESQEWQASHELWFPEFSFVSLVLMQGRRRWELEQCLYRCWSMDLSDGTNNYLRLYLEVHKRMGLILLQPHLSRALTRDWRGIAGSFQSTSCLSGFSHKKNTPAYYGCI